MGLIATESNGMETEALYREYGAAVARLCWSLLRDRSEVEDATQQVFLSAHRALLNGAAPREPLAWLLAVARNECYARFRQRAVTPVPTGEGPDGASADASVHVLRAGELANLWDEVGRMPPTQREAFLLREIRGLSYGQLADALSLSPPSVRSLLLRARTRIRQRLGDVAAGLGSAPWVQALLRLLAGGDGASPLPAASKAAAVGIGALALAGGGSLVAHQASKRPAHNAAHHRAAAHVRHATAPAAVGAAPQGDRSGLDVRRSERQRPRDRADGSNESGPNESGSGHSGPRDGSDSGGSSRDGSDDKAVVLQPRTDGGGGGSSSPGSGRDGPPSGSSDGGAAGSSSGSGSGDGSGSAGPTTTLPGSGGSESSGSSGSGGSDDSGSSVGPSDSGSSGDSGSSSGSGGSGGGTDGG